VSQDHETYKRKEESEMNQLVRVAVLVTIFAVGASFTPAATDLRDTLRSENIASMRVSLNPWGGQIGFEIEFAGDDPRVEALAAVIRQAEPGGGHKCANAGAIRFRTRDGRKIGVGLLPSHTPGLYEFRLYDGDHFVAAYRVDRAVLLAALQDLGVPIDDPAFKE
jgi:hypothetical protein